MLTVRELSPNDVSERDVLGAAHESSSEAKEHVSETTNTTCNVDTGTSVDVKEKPDSPEYDSSDEEPS